MEGIKDYSGSALACMAWLLAQWYYCTFYLVVPSSLIPAMKKDKCKKTF